ncbi:Crp/Fnr family transcriptional regulator [Panacibacter ginsenosidivorans]|uniref:Crp/Fnr family transcriptional regulator n=1 Tax=Panacibacter ginsenosidivorans TaxID=1813871 RepID=A0A5B8V2P2_9BACT|nr:Crp/Fnr family transcriptional regulator [Panacibacter ginsenosidivorans]QEC65777.1 Crp/Fnr family transcriptional regulator [Panacibacter ginsenosidivorans]
MIQQDLLLAWGGTFRKYEKNQPIFFEGDKPLFYYQVMEGTVRMANINDDGKEFIQGIFKKGESFGEPVLFLDEPYPATAIANEACVVMRITKENFLYILKEYPDIHLSITRILAARIYNKSILSKEIAGETPEHRIKTMLHLLKQQNNCRNNEPYKVELSRQQIADMTGLRTETVIRIMRKLHERGELHIEKGKVFL